MHSTLTIQHLAFSSWNAMMVCEGEPGSCIAVKLSLPRTNCSLLNANC